MDTLITKEMLATAGITVTPDEEEALLDHLNETLEERVGLEITDSLVDQQLEALATLQEQDDPAAIQQWLAENVPELQDIIKDEIDILLGEVAENADGINAA
jgi:hypothetical protein